MLRPNRLWILVLILLAHGLTGSEEAKTSVRHQCPKRQVIPTVRICDLVKDPRKYAGKPVRLHTWVLAWLDSASLYDRACEEAELIPVLDCKDDESCSVMQKALAKDTSQKGDMGRVDAVLLGRLILPDNKIRRRPRYEFKIEKVERTRRISRKVP